MCIVYIYYLVGLVVLVFPPGPVDRVLLAGLLAYPSCCTHPVDPQPETTDQSWYTMDRIRILNTELMDPDPANFLEKYEMFSTSKINLKYIQ